MLRILPRICESHTLGHDSGVMPSLTMRVGIHTGPVIAAVIGKTDQRYHLFGRTVSYAEKMESTGTPGAVQVSSATYELVRAVDRYTFERRLDSPNQAGGGAPQRRSARQTFALPCASHPHSHAARSSSSFPRHNRTNILCNGRARAAPSQSRGDMTRTRWCTRRSYKLVRIRQTCGNRESEIARVRARERAFTRREGFAVAPCPVLYF
jgi:hypothetical protein